MTNEPSVLDYILAKLQFWKKNEIDFDSYLRDNGRFQQVPADLTSHEKVGEDSLHALVETAATPTQLSAPDLTEPLDNLPSVGTSIEKKPVFPWRLLVSLVMIFFGQLFMELGGGENNPFVKWFTSPESPAKKHPFFALVFYGIAAGLLIWSFMEQELKAPNLGKSHKGTIFLPVKKYSLLISLPFLVIAAGLMDSNRFTAVNVTFWIIGIALFVNSLWVKNPNPSHKLWEKVKNTFGTESIKIEIRWFDVLLIFVAVLALFFRLYLLDSVPAEMFSDQAEKLMDVQDILDGQTSIFFPRNTGREAFQMYLSALVARFVGIQFLTLKIGTALCGLLMLPYVYLLGKEIANRRVGLYAVLFASFAYWPNVIARVGLRYILYAAFAAPVLYYLFRGLRREHRNDFILAGIFLGIGLHGYSSFRFVPIVVVAIGIIYLLHYLKDNQKAKMAVFEVLIIGLVSLTIFIPLLRYWAQNPEMFSYRVATRLGTAEAQYPEPWLTVFGKNFVKAMLMFFNDNGEIWVHSVTYRPALDLITAGFYFIGGLVMFLEYFKKWSWEYLSLLISIPLLLMPSILSLAFPAENPCLNRTAAAMIPVFILAGFGMDAFMSSVEKKLNRKSATNIMMLLIIVLFVISAGLNYDLVFNQYANQFVRGAWNTSDIGAVIKEYALSYGSYDSAYVIPYPYWVDTRLVGINAGVPRVDYALSPEFISETVSQPSPKLFIFNYDDMATLETLTNLYPEGTLKFHDDQYEGKDFYIFLVP